VTRVAEAPARPVTAGLPDGLREAVGTRASDVAHLRLLEAVVDLRLAPGSVVNEAALAESLGLGRMPVREAIARLAADGFLLTLPRRGTVVVDLSLEAARQLFEARDALQCGIARIAARRAGGGSADPVSALEELRVRVRAAEQARDGTDPEAFLLADCEVHLALVRLANNGWLAHPTQQLLLHNLRFWRHYFRAQPDRQASMVSHVDLLEAVERGDEDAAEAAMREHLTRSRGLLDALFR
jgi:DNA-binding GntR family transcriptional regulator